MEESIFENAKFGDKFVIRNNDNKKEFIGIIRSVRQDCNFVSIVTQPKDGCANEYFDYSNYKSINDRKSRGKERVYRNIEVVSRYQEPIDENKLDELANEDFAQDRFTNIKQIESYYKMGFKAGYRKAMEE